MISYQRGHNLNKYLRVLSFLQYVTFLCRCLLLIFFPVEIGTVLWNHFMMHTLELPRFVNDPIALIYTEWSCLYIAFTRLLKHIKLKASWYHHFSSAWALQHWWRHGDSMYILLIMMWMAECNAKISHLHFFIYYYFFYSFLCKYLKWQRF